MSFSLALVLAIGAPLTLLGLGFFILSLKLYRSRVKESQIEDLIFQVKSLEQNVRVLENRVDFLEDILLTSESKNKVYNQ
ncbi:MAG: hypothetical protein LBI10_05905 [Deltaproteobacteria bacterium]|jgi:hypothetical protein|nr:hypothetical protein [Deltaproteobacteria bacterium]